MYIFQQSSCAPLITTIRTLVTSVLTEQTQYIKPIRGANLIYLQELDRTASVTTTFSSLGDIFTPFSRRDVYARCFPTVDGTGHPVAARTIRKLR